MTYAVARDYILWRSQLKERHGVNIQFPVSSLFCIVFWQEESYESRDLCNRVIHLCVRYAYIVHLERILHVL